MFQNMPPEILAMLQQRLQGQLPQQASRNPFLQMLMAQQMRGPQNMPPGAQGTPMMPPQGMPQGSPAMPQMAQQNLMVPMQARMPQQNPLATMFGRR